MLCVALSGFSLSAAFAQTSTLRGGLDDDTTGDGLRRRVGEATQPTVSPDLLDLGEAVSPLGAPARGGGAAATPDAGTTATDANATPAPTLQPIRPPVRATLRGGPVVPVAPRRPVDGAEAKAPVPAIEPSPRDAEATKREEAEKEDDAYAPLGLRAGGMIWYPAIETSIARKTNVDSTAGGRAATAITIQPELIGRSDWSRHSLELTLRGSRIAYPDASDQSQNSGEVSLRGRLDLPAETGVEIGANWSRQRESASANEASTTGVGTDRQTTGLSLGLRRDVGLIGLSLRGAYERNEYFANGGVPSGAVDPATQNNDRWTTTLRATLGPTRSLAPFVEVEGSLRRYDQEIVYGSRRDGEGGAVRVGVAADAGPVLRGEISTGWGWERPKDDALSAMSGWLLDGNLVWSPNRLIVVRTKLKSVFEPTTNVGSPGALTRTLAVDLDWALRRELTVTVGGGYADKHYYDIDVDEHTTSLSSGLTWKFDRTFQTFVRAKWDHVTASNAAAYDVGTFTTGVRIQRFPIDTGLLAQTTTT